MKKVSSIFFCCLLLLLLTFTVTDAAALRQRPGLQAPPVPARLDSIPRLLRDSLPPQDTLQAPDSLHGADTASYTPGKSSLEVPAFSNAKDSMISVFSDGRRLIYYYGSTNVKYQDMELTADYMEYDLNSGIVFARGVYDSLAGEWNGQPVMKQGNQTYNMEEVRYNFNTRKARIKNMVTNDNEGILHGRDIKLMDDRSINLSHGKYTVCDDEHPHYYIDLSVGKVISQTKTTVFGPAHLVIEDVHLPFVGLPFGFIPKRPQRATGLLMPTFGEEEQRGFYMRDLGMYFVFGDHFDLSVTGDYYTLGSWGVDINSRYQVKYKFNGSFSLNYSNDQRGEKGAPDFFQTRNFGVKWSHSMDTKAHPGTTFSASVDFQSPSNSRYNSHTIEEALNNRASSSISWSHSWNGKIRLSITARHDQNSRDSTYTFNLPNINFNVPTFYPFKRKNRVGKERAYEKISFGYTTNFQNKVVNIKSTEFTFDNAMLEKFQNSMSHDFSIGLPSFQLFKYIGVSPSVTYDMDWYFKKTEYAYNPETDKVEAQPSHQFNTFGITQSYGASLSMNTQIFGMFNFGKHHRIQAIRHVISPSLSINWRPDLDTWGNGHRTLVYTDAEGTEQQYKYNIYGNAAPGGKQSASLNLNIGNNFEAKVRDFADTTGSGTKKIKLIDQLMFRTGYDFMRDSLNLNNLSITMQTSVFGKLNINGGASLSPYAIGPNNRVYNHFAVTEGQGLLRLNEMSLSVSYSLSGKGKLNGYDGTGSNGRGSSATDYYQRIYYHPVTGEYIPGGWVYYSNPNAPWSLNFDASFSLNRSYTYNKESLKLEHKNNLTATLNLSGNIKLTPKMSIQFRSGYDFIAKQITSTSINASYDLHCFNIAVSWIPTGFYKSYSFRIAANASALADLLRFKRSSSYWDN